MAKKAPLLREFVHNRYLRSARLQLKPRTVLEYERLLDKLILPEFGDRLLTSLSKKGVARWHQTLAEDAPYQANRALAVLSAVLSLAVDPDEILTSNPARGVKRAKEKGRESILTREQVRTFLRVCGELSPVEGSFLLTMLYTGARPGELFEARWEWLYEDTLQLPDSKTGKRTIYLPHAALTSMAPADGARTGRIWDGARRSDVLWKQVKRLAGGELDGVRLYDLRHTFASIALHAGQPLETISQLLGHRDPRTTRRYVHLMRGTGRKAVEAIGDALADGAGEG